MISGYYDLRSNNNTLMLPEPNTNAMKRTFGYRGAMLWNLNHENKYSLKHEQQCFIGFKTRGDSREF